MYRRSLFDPLRFLKEEIQCDVAVETGGRVKLGFGWRHAPESIQRAKHVVMAYERLIALQIQEGGASVQKLMARGRIKLEGKRYVLVK